MMAGPVLRSVTKRAKEIVYKDMTESLVVDQLQALSYREIGNLFLVQEDYPRLRVKSADGVPLTVDVETLASALPLHLIGCVTASSGNESRLQYWLGAVRLLHTFGSLALWYPKISQVLLEDVKVRMQIIHLVTDILVVLASMEQENRGKCFDAILHASLVACSLHLLEVFISKEDFLVIAPVILAHPKVNVFMDASFDVVKRLFFGLQVHIRSLTTKLSAEKTTLAFAERIAQVTATQCEASLQLLYHLSAPPTFRDEVLGRKELCKKGGISYLVLAVLRLQLPPAFSNCGPLKATMSRCKAKALKLMINFTESDRCYFLDEVTAETHGMLLTVQVVHQVLLLVRGALLDGPRLVHDEEEEKKNPTGMLHITSLKLAVIFSNDTNTRNLVMDQISPDLATVVAAEPTKFQERWCGGPIAQELATRELDATLLYDPFGAAGEAMAASAKVNAVGTSSWQEESFSPPNFHIAPLVANSHQLRAALLVKLFANFFNFDPQFCSAYEQDRFLETFLRCLWTGPLDTNHALFFITFEQTAVRICENIHTLYDYVLISAPEATSMDEDLLLISEFADALHRQICASATVVAKAPPSSRTVRDGHEQKLRRRKNEREKLERWQRLINLRNPGHGIV